jgi:WD40 repeat protein
VDKLVLAYLGGASISHDQKGHSALEFVPFLSGITSGSYDQTVRLWDATAGAARGTLKGHSSSATAVAFSPDGKLLASGSGDNTVRLWDATTKAGCGTLEVDTDIRNLSFLSCGQYLRTDGGVPDVRLTFPETGFINSAFLSAYHGSHD